MASVVLSVHLLAQRGDSVVDAALSACVCAAGFLDEFLGLVDYRLCLVARLDELFAFLVRAFVDLGVAAHLLDFLFAQARGLYRDVLRLTGRLVLRRDVDYAVGIDVEGYLNLRNSARRGLDSVEEEAAQRDVVARHRALALEDVYLDLRLVVRGGCEHLALGDRYRGVLVDYLREDAAEGFKAERKRSYVDEDDALLFA